MENQIKFRSMKDGLVRPRNAKEACRMYQVSRNEIEKIRRVVNGLPSGERRTKLEETIEWHKMMMAWIGEWLKIPDVDEDSQDEYMEKLLENAGRAGTGGRKPIPNKKRKQYADSGEFEE